MCPVLKRIQFTDRRQLLLHHSIYTTRCTGACLHDKAYRSSAADDIHIDTDERLKKNTRRCFRVQMNELTHILTSLSL